MVRINFPKDVASALAGTETVLVVAPAYVFEARNLPKLLPIKAHKSLLEVAADTKPGDMGAIGSTLTNAEPRKVVAGVLPNVPSRYNSGARAESIYKVVHSAALATHSTSQRSGKAVSKPAIFVILEDDSHVIPTLNALGRAFPLYSRKSEDATAPETQVEVVLLDRHGALIKPPAMAREIMHTAREVARLVDTPPSDMNPEALAGAARDLCADLANIKIKEIVGNDLLKSRLAGIHAVGRAALSPPRLLLATYTPARAVGPHIALVGKGITFDTGGLHLKARGMMETMKSDMGGSAAMVGAFRVLVKSKPKHALSLLMCLAENAIGPASYKPDDILTLHSGKTVEINNTDAEGRLLLADGVSYAARVLNAQYIIDAATLTGAQITATGMFHAAVISNDAELERHAVEAGQASGDLVHPLPFAPEFYRQEFKSTLADMKNSVKDRGHAQTSCAAQFIYNHIEDTDVKWCHIDLAGPSFRSERGTGYGVALIHALVGQITQ